MAIDNAEKRRSASGVPFLPLGPGVTPNSNKDTDWRQQVAWSYSGIQMPLEPPEGGVQMFIHPLYRRRRRNGR